jgi:hypothetical protein
MWHQYGVQPQGDEGIYMDVVDIPQSWRIAREGDTRPQAKSLNSLAESLGFSQNPVRLGNTRNRKAISEAIVAIPFIDVGGVKKFFEIQRGTVDRLVASNLNSSLRSDSPTVFDMIKKMRKYNFPPKFDFLRNKEIVPFAMYIFEFYHILNETDLSNIWQGLPPDIGLKHEEVEASISHPLLAKELLGGGFGGNNTRTGERVPEKIKWLVFKVKKKAKKNYYRKILSKQGVQGVADIPENLNYNWPYDFFSLVELAKIDAEFTFSDITLDGTSVSNVPRGRESFEKSTRTEALLNATNDPVRAVSISSQATADSFIGGIATLEDPPDPAPPVPIDLTMDFFDFDADVEDDPEEQNENQQQVDTGNPPPTEPQDPIP